MRLLLSALLFASFSLSCGSTGLGKILDPYTPKVSYKKLNLTKLDFQNIGVDFVFNVKNPNPINVKLAEFGYRFGLSGVEFLNGRNTDGFQLKSRGDSELSIPVALGFKQIFNMVNSTKGRDEIPFSIAGDFGFKTPVGVAKIPFRKEGDFPVVHTPSIGIKNARFSSFEPLRGKARLEVDLGFKNTNGKKALQFKGFDYGLKLQGHKISSGILNNVPAARGGQEQVVSLPIDLNLLSLGQSIVSLVNGNKPVQLGLDAKVMVGTPFGDIPLNVTEIVSQVLR